MKIKSIAVEVRETVSLPGYCNSTRGVILTGEVHEGDSEEASYRFLKYTAEERVHGELDAILEAAGEPPKFFEGQRFDVLCSDRLRCVAAIPAGHDGPASWWRIRQGFREAQAKAFAEKHAGACEYTVMQWSQEEGLPSLAGLEMTGVPRRTRDVGPEPDYCEECHEELGGLDPVHLLCDDCYQAEDEHPPDEAAQAPGDPDPGDWICPKCDPNPNTDRVKRLCYAHSLTDKELEEECGF